MLDPTHDSPVWGRALSDTLADTIYATQPYAVLFAATADGRELAARITAQPQLGLTGDAIDLEINPHEQLVHLKAVLGGPEHLPTVQALARSLGAALATTRNVVHAGWLPHHIQVGLSGWAIAPRSIWPSASVAPSTTPWGCRKLR